MKKLASTLPNMIIALGVMTIVASALLAWANSVTAAPIAAAEKQTRVDAIKDVLPAFDNDPLAKAQEVNVIEGGNPFIVYPAFEGDKFVGAAVEGYTLNGFSGEVKVCMDLTPTVLCAAIRCFPMPRLPVLEPR